MKVLASFLLIKDLMFGLVMCVGIHMDYTMSIYQLTLMHSGISGKRSDVNGSVRSGNSSFSVCPHNLTP